MWISIQGMLYNLALAEIIVYDKAKDTGGVYDTINIQWTGTFKRGLNQVNNISTIVFNSKVEADDAYLSITNIIKV